MQKKRLCLLYVFGLLLLAALALLSLCLGAVPVSLPELFSALSGDRTGRAYAILRYVRLPRTVAAMLCGLSLASSGALIQTVLHNPLGSPTVLGMNAGSALAVMLAAAFLPPIFTATALPLAAFLGAFCTLLLVSALGKAAGGSKAALLLSGVAAGTFFTACADALTVLFPDSVYSRTAFKIGSLSGVQFSMLLPAAGVIFLALLLTALLSRDISVLSLGDETAESLGLPVEQVRVAALALASLLCGAGISFAGLVGFVGLIVPHIARFLVGSRLPLLLSASALFGSSLVLLCDLLSRLVFAPYELPVGILLSFIGGPFFLALLLNKRGARHA